MGRDYDRKIQVGNKETQLWKHIQKMTFPGVQGTPYLNHIAAKAVFFKETLSKEYRSRQFRIIANAQRLAENLVAMGYDVLTGGTDNHMVLINVANSRDGLTGVVAQKCLEDCGIIVNMNRLPYDTKGPAVASGIRLGTPVVTKNGMGVEQMDIISEMVDKVLKTVRIINDTEYEIDENFCNEMTGRVSDLCERFVMY
jgi:glycine hydroxymethyltransferase